MTTEGRRPLKRWILASCFARNVGLLLGQRDNEQREARFFSECPDQLADPVEELKILWEDSKEIGFEFEGKSLLLGEKLDADR